LEIITTTSNSKQKILSRQGQRKGDAGSFFDSQGIIHYEFIPQGVTVNKEMYTDIIYRLIDAVRRKHPEKWRTNSWFLLHDNALAHQSVLVKDFLPNNNVTTLSHPPYSHHLAPADFYLFP